MSSLPVYCLTQMLSQLPPDDRWLAPAERARASAFRFPKRRNDWLLGRWTAKEAVRSYLSLTGCEVPQHASLEIRSAPDGAPEAFLAGDPVGVALALSHCRDHGFCAVAPAGVALGCDLEAVEPREPPFIADYFNDSERERIMCAPAAEQPLLATLLWGAKESVLKCLREGLRRDTRSVAVHLCAANSPGWNPFTACCEESGRPFHGWWRCVLPFVQTMASSIPSHEPVGLRETEMTAH